MTEICSRKRRSAEVLTWLLALIVAWPEKAFAWGSLGHRIVAESAALLIEDTQPDTLGNLLARHRFELGVYAFQPDSTFRHHDDKSGALEGPLHFLSVDALGALGPYDAPYDQVLPLLDKAGTTGRVPWRIEQLQKLVHEDWRKVPAVFGSYQRGATAEEPQKSVFRALYRMGVLAHYAGDIAVPHHAAKDSNSFGVGQGGLHFYYEGDCPSVFEPALAVSVLALARKQRATWVKQFAPEGATPVTIALNVLRSSLAALPALEAADKTNILTPSKDQGFAKRKPPAEGCRALRKSVEERLALGAVITAELWQRAVPYDIDWKRVRTLQFNDLYDSEQFIAFP